MSIFAELKRRNVFRVGIAYAIAAWLLIQIADVMIDNIGAPDWVFRTLLLVLTIGFPISLILAWAFEVTPEGIKREEDVDRSQSVTASTGKKLNGLIIAMLLALAAYFFWESRFQSERPASTETELAMPEQSVEPAAPLVALDPNAIAVLPFINRSNLEEDLFFTDGMHDDLLTQLAKIDNLKVISRTSMMVYRDTEKQIPEIAAELGVGIILEGGVQRAGDRVRINAQLIEVETDQHLWAETYDRQMTIDNIFDIQSEISRQIVTAVKGEVSPEETERLNTRPTDSLAAWELYQQAQAIFREPDYERGKYSRAEPLIREALEADPEFATAMFSLARILLQRDVWMGVNNTQAVRDEARQYTARAVALEPGSAAALAAQAEIEYRINLDYQRSLELLDQALVLAPGDVTSHHSRGLSLRRLGRWEDAVQAFGDALEYDPLDAFTAATLAETLAAMNEWDRLEPFLDRWLTIAPRSADLTVWKVRLLIHKYGDLEQASELLESFDVSEGNRLSVAFTEVATMQRDWERLLEIESDPGNIGFMAVLDWTRDFRLGRAYALKGDQETAKEYLERYMARSRTEEKFGAIAQSRQALNMATASYFLGNKEEALAYAQKAESLMTSEIDAMFNALLEDETIRIQAWAGDREVALNRLANRLEKTGELSAWKLYLDPAWDFLRDDPRFNELARPEGVEPEPFRNQRLGDGT